MAYVPTQASGQVVNAWRIPAATFEVIGERKMSPFSLAPRCTPLSPGPTLLDGWRTAPGWLVVVGCVALLSIALMWHDIRWMRRAGDRSVLTRWSVALVALGYSSFIAFAVVAFGVLLPLDAAQSVWVDHSLATADRCQSAIALLPVMIARQGQQGKEVLLVALVLLLPTYWGVILSRRFIRRAHFAKMERGLEHT